MKPKTTTCRRKPGSAWLAGLSLAALVAAAPACAQSNPLTDPAPKGGEAPAAAPQEALAGQAEVPQAAPSATDIIRSLAPFVDGNPHAGGEVREVDAEDGKRRVRVDYGHAIDITVFFPYDSAQLTPDAKAQLEPLGRALQSRELMLYRFLVAGHTDAAGDPGYNRVLSLRRALAVRGFLVRAYGIDPLRLVVHGWGQTRLKRPDEPLSGVNRRVEIALIAPPKRSSALDGRVDDAPVEIDAGAFGAGWQVVSGCRAGPADPRWRLPSDALDDFGAAPTPVSCRAMAGGDPIVRFNAWYDPRRHAWSGIDD